MTSVKIIKRLYLENYFMHWRVENQKWISCRPFELMRVFSLFRYLRLVIGTKLAIDVKQLYLGKASFE